MADIRTYLQDAGWLQQQPTWRGASIWSHPDGYEVLVPPRDDVADADLRVREILGVLAKAEGRATEEIAGDMTTPFTDIQLYRTFASGLPDGTGSLLAGVQALHGVRDLFSAAARTIVEGPMPVFPGGPPRPVSELLQEVQLGPGRADGAVFTVRVPVGRPPGAEPLTGRQVARQLYEAVAAAHTATAEEAESGLAAFDGAVTAGVSANLCTALSELAGSQRQQPFEVAFRWGRGLATDLPASTWHFGAGTGRVIRAAATHLRQLGVSGTASVTGLVESLHDQPPGPDRWRVKIRAGLSDTGGPANRTSWVRFDGPAAYDQAIAAHRAGQLVRAVGELAVSDGRVELLVRSGDFDVLA
jgi:hypothetical protein